MADVFDRLAALVPGGGVLEASFLDAGDDCGSPYAEECLQVQGSAASRQREYFAVRAVARRALSRLGVQAGPLLKTEEGPIRWPQGSVGSVTHTRSWCAAIVALARDMRGLGLDAEDARRMTPRVARRVLRDEEWEVARARQEDLAAEATLFFCAKEAFYKAYYPVYRAPLGFEQVRILWRTATESFRTFAVEIRKGGEELETPTRAFQGRADSFGNWVCAICWH